MKSIEDTIGEVKKFIDIDGEDAILTDSKLTEYVFDNCDIFFNDTSRYFCQTRVANEMYITYKEILLKNQCEPQAGVNLLLSSLIPEWQSSCRKDLYW